MRIKDITCSVVAIPLSTTFKTALRTVDRVDNVLVAVATESGLVGYGSAAPAAVIMEWLVARSWMESDRPE